MPQSSDSLDEAGRESWHLAIRNFHLSGEGALSGVEPLDAVPLRPDLKEPRRRLADDLLLLGRPAEALEVARELQQEDPDYEDIALIAAMADGNNAVRHTPQTIYTLTPINNTPVLRRSQRCRCGVLKNPCIRLKP